MASGWRYSSKEFLEEASFPASNAFFKSIEKITTTTKNEKNTPVIATGTTIHVMTVLLTAIAVKS